ncbi:MAG: hypothetical protein ABSC57_10035 [Syntrophales bacterium]
MEQIIFLIGGKMVVYKFEYLEIISNDICAENLILKVIGFELDDINDGFQLPCLKIKVIKLF